MRVAEEDLADYGLDDTKITLAVTADGETLTFARGDQAESGDWYMRCAEDGTVRLVSDNAVKIFQMLDGSIYDMAALPVLAELLLPFVRVGGKAVCYKGPAAEEEWDAGQRAARLLGGGKLERTPIVLPGQEDWEHCVIALPKEAKTVRQYPRKAGTPGREPLGQNGGRKQEARNGKSAPSER